MSLTGPVNAAIQVGALTHLLGHAFECRDKNKMSIFAGVTAGIHVFNELPRIRPVNPIGAFLTVGAVAGYEAIYTFIRNR
jgi:hypothetical protein